jgi:phosphate transport system permease protein
VFIVIGTITWNSRDAMAEFGWGFLTEETWDPNTGEYGILPQICGTLYSSFLALLVGGIFGLAVAIFLSERMLSGLLFWLLKKFNLQFHPFWGRLPDGLENVVKNLVELLAAIPSVVYGIWGLVLVIPLIRPPCNWLHEQLGFIPFFGTPLPGPGLLPAAMVLSIMILPTVSAISRDALVAVPMKLREASYGLGATRWETILGVILPTASKGIFGAVILAFGRALGETMALAMLAGNANNLSWSLFSPIDTLAALLANNFGEASKEQVPILMYAALVLLAITLLVNIAGAWVVQQATSSLEGTR